MADYSNWHPASTEIRGARGRRGILGRWYIEVTTMVSARYRIRFAAADDHIPSITNKVSPIDINRIILTI